MYNYVLFSSIRYCRGVICGMLANGYKEGVSREERSTMSASEIAHLFYFTFRNESTRSGVMCSSQPTLNGDRMIKAKIYAATLCSHTRTAFESNAKRFLGYYFFVYFFLLHSSSSIFQKSTYGLSFKRHDISTGDSRNSMTWCCLGVQMDACSFVRTTVHSCAHKLLIPFPISAEGPILFCFIAFHISRWLGHRRAHHIQRPERFARFYSHMLFMHALFIPSILLRPYLFSLRFFRYKSTVYGTYIF